MTRAINPPKVANIGSTTLWEAALAETVGETEAVVLAGISLRVIVTVKEAARGGAVTGPPTAVLEPRIKSEFVSVPDTITLPAGSGSCPRRICECIAIGQTIRELKLET